MASSRPTRLGNLFKLLYSVALGALAFNWSGRWYFNTKPLFSVPYFAQTLLGFTTAALAYFILPAAVSAVRGWLEALIAQTVSRIVSDFWGQQSQRLSQSRRRKQKEKSQRVKKKREEELFRRGSPVILDTSAIIDGRILGVVETGFLGAVILVPQFVVDELQAVADSENDLKRQRGRRGFEILESIKKIKGPQTFRLLTNKDKSSEGDVDRRLVALAKKYRGQLCTVDYNLNKAAGVSGVKVLNVNDLSNAVKTVVLPGEPLKIKVVQPGKEAAQGVGYLEDGTMVVVEDGRHLLAKTITVIVSRILQTSAGKMVFARYQKD